MIIPVNQLKKFQKLSSHIKSNNILPIYGYLQFGGGYIRKNVGTAFVNFICKEADEDLLVDESDLFGLLNVTNTTAISITKKGSKIKVTDGRDYFDLVSPKHEEFPNSEVPAGSPINISEEFMEAVAKASHFATFIKDAPTYYGFVHIGEKTVCAGDGIIIFHCPVEEDVKIVLDNKIAQVLSKYNIHSFQESESHYYFHNSDSVFGFSKPDTGWFDIRRLFQQERAYSFTLDASDLTSFNSLALQLSKACQVTVSDGKLEMNDPYLNKHHERPAENIKIPAPFLYNPEKMNALIAGMDVETMDFSDSKPCYFISSKGTNATAIIAKISKS